MILTDPPYNVGKDYGDAVDDEQTAAAYLSWTREWFAAIRPLTRSAVAITPGITNLPMWIADVERTHKIIAWLKENQNSRNYIGPTSGFNVWEPILIYGQAKKMIPHDAFSIPIGIQIEADGHPCPKSLKAWSWLVEALSDEGDTVLDPFLGAGTTLVACQQLKRRGLALEIEPKYAAISLERLAQMGLEVRVEVS